jgi:hypothetical protein
MNYFQKHKVETIFFGCALIWLLTAVYLVNGHTLNRDLMMRVEPVLFFVFSLFGFTKYFGRKHSDKYVLLRSVSASSVLAFVSFVVFLIFTFESAWL